MEFDIGDHGITWRFLRQSDHEKLAIGTGTESSGITVWDAQNLLQRDQQINHFN